MKTRRTIVEPAELEAIAGGAAPLPNAVSHHLTRVLRLAAGASIGVADGEGHLVEGELCRREGRWWLMVLARRDSVLQRAPLTLFAGVLKHKRWRMVLEKAAELGVGRVVPITTARSAWRPGPRDNAPEIRWRSLAREALVQCERPWAPIIEAPTSLESALATAPHGVRLVGSPGTEPGQGWPDAPAGTAVSILVGPEGGLTPEELILTKDAGFAEVSLGAFPLRAETACVALCALARDRYGIAEGEAELWR